MGFVRTRWVVFGKDYNCR